MTLLSMNTPLEPEILFFVCASLMMNALYCPVRWRQEEGMRLIQEYCDSCEGDGELQYCIVAKATWKYWNLYAEMDVCEERDYFDYLYEVEDILG